MRVDLILARCQRRGQTRNPSVGHFIPAEVERRQRGVPLEHPGELRAGVGAEAVTDQIEGCHGLVQDECFAEWTLV